MSKLLELGREKLESSHLESRKVDLSCITAQQLRFCRRFLANGFQPGEAAQFAGYRTKNYPNVGRSTLNQPSVKYFIRKEMSAMNEELKIDFEWKMRKLKLAVDYSIPDCIESPDDLKNLKSGISAISEMNKMQGDYAPVKTVNANMLGHEEDKEKFAEYCKTLEKPY